MDMSISSMASGQMLKISRVCRPKNVMYYDNIVNLDYGQLFN